MKTDHPHAKLMRETMERMNDEPGAIADHLADDVVWHEIGNPEPLRGKQAVLEAFGSIRDRVSFAFTPYGMLGDDDIVISYGRAELTSGDRSTAYDAVEIHRLTDGKVTERWAMVGDMDAMTSFWEAM